MLIIGYCRDRSGPSGAAIHETAWDTSDWFDLRANGVPASSSEWTIAMAGRAKANAREQYWLGMNGGSAFFRRNAGTLIRYRWQTTTGSIVSDTTTSSGIADDQLWSTLFSISAPSQVISGMLNGAALGMSTSVGISDLLHGPSHINSSAGSSSGASVFNLRGIWIGEGYLDAATHYVSFFSGDGVPTAAMLNGDSIGGLSPSFAEGGDAAVWEAYAGGKSGSFDLSDA